jgi:hypothetical protein
MRWLGKFAVWSGLQYIEDYRESKSRAYELIVKNNIHLNTVVLTVSVASLTAVAALNEKAFQYHPVLSFAVISLFVLVILLSTVNFYISGLAIRDIQKKLSKDILFPVKVSRGGYEQRFKKIQKVLSVLVLSGFCLGLIALLALLGFYILGAE